MIIKIELDGGLDKFISGANSAAAAVDSMEERIVRQAGTAGLENVAANIHSRSGRLAQSYTVGGNENIFDVQAGGGSASVRYGSNCPYAVPAEEAQVLITVLLHLICQRYSLVPTLPATLPQVLQTEPLRQRRRLRMWVPR